MAESLCSDCKASLFGLLFWALDCRRLDPALGFAAITGIGPLGLRAHERPAGKLVSTGLSWNVKRWAP